MARVIWDMLWTLRMRRRISRSLATTVVLCQPGGSTARQVVYQRHPN
jgi:hypothetical protein